MVIMNDDFPGLCECSKPTVMENKTSPGSENMERPEMETSDSSRQLTDSRNSKPYYLLFSDNDILLDEFQEEEYFILNEEFVRMEEEYVMWEGTLPCCRKNKEKDVFEIEQLSLPEDGSLHHLEEYFTLKTNSRSKRHA